MHSQQSKSSPAQILQQGVVFHRAGKLAEAERLYSEVLRTDPDRADAQFLLGTVRFQQGRDAEALRLIGASLQMDPRNPFALSNYGNVLLKLKRYDEAVARYEQALAIKPDHVEALNNLGMTLKELKRYPAALASYDRALAIRPNFLEALFNRGNALQELRRHAEALACYDKVLALRPGYAQAHNNAGLALKELGRRERALASYDKALSIHPDFAEALNNRGIVLEELGRYDDAIASYQRALQIRPDFPEALNNLGYALYRSGRCREALARYEQALALDPRHADALNNRGTALEMLGRRAEALASFEQALAIRPDHVPALNNRGNVLHWLERLGEAVASFEQALAIDTGCVDALKNRGKVLQELGRYPEALASYDRALAVRPDDADAFNDRGSVLQEMRRDEEALASFERALSLRPDHPYAFGGLAHSALAICDWTRTAKVDAALPARINERKSLVRPLTLLAYRDDPLLQWRCARDYVESILEISTDAPLLASARHGDRIRVAYLSADFREHATAHLIAELIELHDRSRFEVVGASFGADDRSAMRDRLVEGFDQFHDVRSMTDREAARLLAELQVDIAVDLKGYTQDSRPGILAHRPAPVQVSYLGYPGTLAADFIDYVIADPIVLPLEQQPNYTENIVHLPDSYQVNDRKREIAAGTPTRADAELPQDGFVFCCFNNNHKITAPVFEVWMRLLARLDGSVLWLFRDNAAAERNLRKEAQARGIDPGRLVFADRLPHPDHLARYRIADLFLDTLPYNAHTTASDALWAGLPVLTCCGRSFAGRVAASLLHAVGLPELVTHGLEEYETLASRLASEPAALGQLRDRLARNRFEAPLFDAGRFRRHLERAYVRMWELQRRGEAPRSFAIEPA
jgi:protein O-GlcNAc transferase